MKHRGRFQAQGENIETSESWAQDNPISKRLGFELLDILKNKIPKHEAQQRNLAFEKAKQFVEQGPHEVVSSPILRSYRVKGTLKERVDIEIQSGTAFVNS